MERRDDLELTHFRIYMALDRSETKMTQGFGQVQPGMPVQAVRIAFPAKLSLVWMRADMTLLSAAPHVLLRVLEGEGRVIAPRDHLGPLPSFGNSSGQPCTGLGMPHHVISD
jgi:hypothetical protein